MILKNNKSLYTNIYCKYKKIKLNRFIIKEKKIDFKNAYK